MEVGDPEERRSLGLLPARLGAGEGPGVAVAPVSGRLVVQEDELPDELVEGRAKVVDGIAKGDAQLGTGLPLDQGIGDIPLIRIELGARDGEWQPIAPEITVEEGSNFKLKSFKVGFCAPLLCPNPS
jgi:hypothetical protein